MSKKESIDYLELPARDLEATKQFFRIVFGWSFEDYGQDYTAFSDARINGGFYRSDLVSSTRDGAALPVFYSEDLEGTEARIVGAGGIVGKAIFSFPGGRRFHFTEPSGNEFAVWSDN